MTGRELLHLRRMLNGPHGGKMTQAELADELGYTQKSISKWENLPEEHVAKPAEKLAIKLGQERGVLDEEGTPTH